MKEKGWFYISKEDIHTNEKIISKKLNGDDLMTEDYFYSSIKDIRWNMLKFDRFMHHNVFELKIKNTVHSYEIRKEYKKNKTKLFLAIRNFVVFRGYAGIITKNTSKCDGKIFLYI